MEFKIMNENEDPEKQIELRDAKTGEDVENDETELYTITIKEIMEKEREKDKKTEEGMSKYTCFTKEQRKVVRSWLLRMFVIIIAFSGLFSFVICGSLGYGVILSSLVLLMFEMLFRIPQLLYEMIRGYPVPHFLCFEGKRKFICFLP